MTLSNDATTPKNQIIANLVQQADRKINRRASINNFKSVKQSFEGQSYIRGNNGSVTNRTHVTGLGEDGNDGIRNQKFLVKNPSQRFIPKRDIRHNMQNPLDVGEPLTARKM